MLFRDCAPIALLVFCSIVVSGCARSREPAAPSSAPSPAAPAKDMEPSLVELRAAMDRDQFELVLQRSTDLLGAATARQRPIDTATIELLGLRGWALWHRNHPSDAQEVFREAESQWRAARLAPSSAMADVWSGLGMCAAILRDDHEAALAYFRQVLDVREHAQPLDPLKTAIALQGVASSLIRLRRPTEAYPLLERAIGLLVAKDKQTEIKLGAALATLAEAHRHARDVAGSEPWFERAVAVLSRHESERGALKLDLMLRLADVKSSLGKKAEARKLLDDALAFARRTPKLASSEPTVLGPLASLIEQQEGTQAAQQFRQANGFVHKVRTTELPPPTKEDPSAAKDSQMQDAEIVVARAQKELRTCYEHALAANEKLAGTARVTMKINASGDVWHAEATTIGLPEAMCDCILDVATRAKFQAPSGGGATIIVPVTYQLRQDD